MSSPDAPADHCVSLAQEFIAFSLGCGVLRFGEFITKAGRVSPYFFNAGGFDTGQKLARLARFYARSIVQQGLQFDMLFGPAYKGIPLVTAVAMALADAGHDYPFAYNRKEAKDHGEGGVLVGAPLKGRVLVIDDVMSAGTAMRESMALIHMTSARVCAVAIALDRQEKATAQDPDGQMQEVPWSAVQYVQEQVGLAVCAIATLNDLLAFVHHNPPEGMADHEARIQAYRQRYGVQARAGVDCGRA